MSATPSVLAWPARASCAWPTPRPDRQSLTNSTYNEGGRHDALVSLERRIVGRSNHDIDSFFSPFLASVERKGAGRPGPVPTRFLCAVQGSARARSIPRQWWPPPPPRRQANPRRRRQREAACLSAPPGPARPAGRWPSLSCQGGQTKKGLSPLKDFDLRRLRPSERLTRL